MRFHHFDRRWFLYLGQHCLQFEVGHVPGSRWAEIRFGSGYVEGIGVTAGFGYGFWLTWKLPWSWTKRIPRWPHDDRDIGVNSFGATVHLKFANAGFGDHYGRTSIPSWWRRWLQPGHRQIKIWDNAWIVGRDKYQYENATERRRIIVPINEWPGDEWPYDIHLETVSWRNRFRTKRRTYWEFKAVDGIAYNQRAGKGENSWDCDDDGIYGCAFEDTGQDASTLIEDMKQRILRDRERYGRPAAARISAE